MDVATNIPPPPPTLNDGNVLTVKDLKTYFFTYDGVVRALDGVTFSVKRGETLGIVGETGCGKSVTAFSITRLIADPPGRVISGQIVFNGANLLWNLEKEAKYVPIKKTNRVNVKRKYGRIKEAHNRLSSIRGKDISMIFQEPTAAMNPVFSIWNQLAEALEIHQILSIIDRFTSARVLQGSDAQQATADLLAAAREPGQPRLRGVAKRVGEAVGLPTVESELYHMLHGVPSDPTKTSKDIRRVLDRPPRKTLARAYIRFVRRKGEVERTMRDLFMREMREGRSYARHRRTLSLRILVFKIQNSWLRLPIIRTFARKALDEELFWQTVLLLENVGIANPVQVAKGYPHELSGGMLQRVMISMALAPEPTLLIADEPTTALDVTIQAQILDLMNELKRRVGTSIMLITHDLGVVAETCDRVCVMYAGVIVEAGDISALFAKPLHPYTQGLIASIPRLDAPDKKLESIPGSVPNLISPPGGCRFHPRCPFVMDRCRTLRPPMLAQGGGHAVACWLYQGEEATDY